MTGSIYVFSRPKLIPLHDQRKAPWQKILIVVILFTAAWLALHLWLGQPLSALGFAADWNFGQHEYVTIVNTGSEAATNVRIRIRADYTCDSAGYEESTAQYPSLPPGVEVRVPYRYSKGDNAEIGAMDVWLTCDRGEAHERWFVSYGMTWLDVIHEIIRELSRSR